MSKANPFDQEMSPRKRLVSNIFFAITTLLVVVFIIWVLVSQPKNVRSDFDYTAGAARGISTAAETLPPTDEQMAADEEFFRLCMELEAAPMAWNADFRTRFPTAASLLQPEDDVFDARKPTVSEGDTCMTLALCTVDGSENNIRRLDVLTLPLASRTEGGAQSAIIYAPRTFTVEYNTGTGVIEAADVRMDNYRLYYYDMTVSLVRTGGWDSAEYGMILNGVISDRQAESGDLFGRISAAPREDIFSAAELSRRESDSLLHAEGGPVDTDTLSLTLHFNDFMYDAFGSIEVTGIPKTAGEATFQVAFNSTT